MKGPPPSETPAFDVEERKIADVTGVQKKVLAARRIADLKEGVDWARVGNAVRYAQAGVKKLLGLLGLREGDGPEKAELEQPPEKNGGAMEGTVAKRFTNRHLLEARLEDGRAVRVWVRDSKNFRLGMKIPVEQRVGEEAWRLTRREPRWPGRW